MLEKKNVNTEVKVEEISMLEASMALLLSVKEEKLVVKPTLGIGKHVCTFKGIEFVQVKFRGVDCMAVQFNLVKDNVTFTELHHLWFKSEAQKEVVVGKLKTHMTDIATQFELPMGTEFTFEDLNKHIDKTLEIEIYVTTKEYMAKDTSGQDTTKIGHDRKFTFKKSLYSSTPATPTEVPKY